MAFKTIFFVCLLVSAVAVPIAEATIFPIPLPLPLPIPTLPSVLIRVTGVLYCTVNANPGALGPLLTPRFANATVQLRCGAANTTVASVTTNSLGQFSIILDPLTSSVDSLLNTCRLVITTPLASCNASLPQTANLSSRLQIVGNSLLAAILRIINLGPVGFAATV